MEKWNHEKIYVTIWITCESQYMNWGKNSCENKSVIWNYHLWKNESCINRAPEKKITHVKITYGGSYGRITCENDFDY